MIIEIIAERSGTYGGLKRLYRLGEYFQSEGHQVAINLADGSRNTWFQHCIPENIDIQPSIRIMPETWQRPHPKARNILYVQAEFDPPVDKYDGIITTSKYLQDKTQEWGYDSVIIPYGIESNIFTPREDLRQKNLVAYMPRKNLLEAQTVGMLTDPRQIVYNAIEGLSEPEVAYQYQRSNIFLAVSRVEGFGLPPFEAGLCGCLVVGYHGWGGAEYLTPETYVPATSPEEMAYLIQKIIGADPADYQKIRSNLRNLILTKLTPCLEWERWKAFLRL